MPNFVRIAARSEMPATNEAREFALGDRMICVANVDGKLSALDNVCLHRGGPLGQGVIAGGKLVCPWHGWEFDPATGAVCNDPSQHVRVYALKFEGEDVLVEVD
jgi:nitrite reductase (NADH) small subunit